MVKELPENAVWSVGGVGDFQLRMNAMSLVAGGGVRVGLEDNIWLEKGTLATNAQLVEKAATIVTNMGATLMTPAEVREKLQLQKRAPKNI